MAPVIAQHVDGIGWYRDRSPAMFRLWCFETDAGGGFLNGALYLSRGSIEIRPTQRQQFAPSHTCGERQADNGKNGITA